jgi:hypothetical protein
MLERHIYSDDFFKFIRDLVGSIKLIDLYSLDPSTNNLKYNLIYEKHEEIPQDLKKTYIQFIRVLAKINFDVLARAHDNAVKSLSYLHLKLNIISLFFFHM